MSQWFRPAVLGGLGVVVVLALGCGRPAASESPPPAAPASAAENMSTPFIWPGLRRPPVHPAAKADLPDDAAVIGVTAGGKSRAYLVSAMSSMTKHVVNDLVGGMPVTVTYCDRADCARAFTADTPGNPLAIDLGGWDQRMLLRATDTFYWQDTAKPVRGDKQFPFERMPCERTTWKAWKEAHPDTEVFTGK